MKNGRTSASPRGASEWRDMSHGEQLARIARRLPDKTAFEFENRSRTFGELDERVTRLARALDERGVEHGDRVAVLMRNGLELVESYLAASRLGAIAVPVNFRLVPDEVRYIVNDSGAAALLVDDTLAEVAARVRSDASALRVCLTTGEPADAGAGAESYEDALAAAGVAPLRRAVGEHDPAFVMYTSGTTGRPKGAVLTHFNLLMNTFHMLVGMGIGVGDEVWLSGLPLFHIGGLNGILPYLMVGGTSIILPVGEFDPEQVVDTLERKRVTGCYFVPTQWHQICAVEGVRERDLALRRIGWGASPAPPSVLEAMADAFPGVPNYNLFGQTEMSSITCILEGGDGPGKMSSVGRPVINVEARIVDDEMNDVPEGEVGEIVYRGPTVMREYWKKPEATAEAFAGGWFHSGDLCRVDEDGFIYVVDRKKDMIVSGGENIYPAEVEATIDRHEGVAEVAVIGIPDDKWVETPRAIVVAEDPASPPTEQDIIGFCREHLASYKKPTSVVVVDELPRNAAGKVLKADLRERYGASSSSR